MDRLDAVAERKRQWRAEVRQRRRARAACADTDPERHAADREQLAVALAAGVFGGARSLLERLPRGSRVAAYQALPTEPPTHVLLAELARAGLAVMLPELLADRDLDWTDPDGAPLGRAAIGQASLLVVPALTVDTLGYRLGQGGGSYDRALTRADPDALVVALLFDDELSSRPVPRADHDARVHAVVRPATGWTDLTRDPRDAGQ